MKLVINLQTDDKLYEESILKIQGVKYKACKYTDKNGGGLESGFIIDCPTMDVFNDIFKLAAVYDIDSLLKLKEDKCYLVEFKDFGFYDEIELKHYFVREEN